MNRLAEFKDWLDAWSWIWWMVGTLGIAGTIFVIAGFVVGWPVLFSSKIGKWLLTIGGVIVTVLLTYASGLKKGAEKEKMRQRKRVDKEVKEVADAYKQLDGMTPEEIDKELSKWDLKK